MNNDEELANELQGMMTGDEEVDHGLADDFLTETLRGAGYEKLAAKFEELSQGFWYA